MSLPMNRVTFITLAVADLARARGYYEALGWELESAMDEVAFSVIRGQNHPSPEAVDAAFAHALACGASPVSAPFKTDWGGYSSYVADPDGHLWEFAFNPFSPLDDEGHIA